MRCRQLLLIIAVFIFSLSYAQEKPGSIAGLVKDARSKAPLIDAVITISSPVLEGQKFAVTDSSGKYKIPDLPSGVYTLSFEMEGFKKYTQENVNLAPGMSLGVSFEMAREQGGATEPARTRFKRREVVTSDDDDR